MTAPFIDFREFLTATSPAGRQSAAEIIGQAAHTTGFFYLVNTSLTAERIARMLDASRTFFAQSDDSKLARRGNGKPPLVGYIARERETLDESRPSDLKEAFNVPHPASGHEPSVVGGIWTGADDPLRVEAEAFAEQCFQVGQQVLSAIALSLGLDETYFTAGHREAEQTLRLLHYFPATETLTPGQLGCGEHSDHGTLTLLLQDDAGGLEFLNGDAGWQPLPPVEGAVLVNAGDLLTRWTGGYVHSARHRVQPPRQHRISLGYFLVPAADVLLRCPPTGVLAGTPTTAKPLTSREFLLLRSLKRSERFYRHHPAPLDTGGLPKGLALMRTHVASELGLDSESLDRRLREFSDVEMPSTDDRP